MNRQKDIAFYENTQLNAEVAPAIKLTMVLKGEMTRQELQLALGLKHNEHFRKVYLLSALADGLIQMTKPDKPNSRLQKYRLTEKGHQILEANND